jgi:hypothetical protein
MKLRFRLFRRGWGVFYCEDTQTGKQESLGTSNRPIEEWGKLLHDVPAASAILDRLLHHADLIEVSGRSYRLHQAARKENKNSGLTAERKN